MANITITKELNEIDLAYGSNIISITDTDVPAITSRYAIQVRDTDYTTILSDVRQLPNLSGYVHFDLQNIFKNQVSHNPAIETTAKLTTAPDEVFVFTIGVGYEDNGVFNLTNLEPVAGEYVVLNGRKPFNEINWDYSEYVPTLNSQSIGGFDFLIVSSVQKALTDRHIESVLGSQITDGKPSTLGASERCWIINKRLEDDYTLSFMQRWINTGNGAPSFYNGIDYFRIYIYNGNTLLSSTDLQNITSNGGGPDASIGGGADITGEYNIISVQLGNLNSIIASEPTATHIYVVPAACNTSVCTAILELGDYYRINIDNGECNDFSPIQVSWVNSFGMRDYYTFEKRNDYNITTQQDTYKQLNADWGGQTYTINAYSRGERVFNKSIEETYVANTKYLSDIESTYLKNLYVSPDVKVRFEGDTTWTPVILTDTQYTERTFRKDKLFQHTINFRLANPQQIQRG